MLRGNISRETFYYFVEGIDGMSNERLNLVNSIRILFIGFMVSLVVIIVILQTLQYKKDISERTHKMRADYLLQQKHEIKQEVLRVVDNIYYQRSMSDARTKEIVKEWVNHAHSIAENIYKKNKNLKSKSEIKNMILSVLRPIRYAENTGYFFVTSLDGFEILFADKPEMEGKNLINMKDTSGNYVIKDMISLVNKSDEGFYTYYWTKPNEEGNNHKKISYVKKFSPFDWFIGTGLYQEDVENITKRRLINEISRVRFGKEGYVFVNSFNGDALVSNGSVHDGTKKLWELFHNQEQMKHIFSLEYNAAKKDEGDYINYTFIKLSNSQNKSPKISFIKGIPEWNWIIGAGVYTDDIEVEIVKLQNVLRQKLYEQIRATLFAIILIFILFMIIFHYTSHFILNDFNLFVKFFDKAAKGGEKINLEKIRFSELYEMGQNANKMLNEKRDAKKDLIEEKEQLTVTLRSIGDAVITTDVENKINLMNYSAEKLTGWMERDALGKPLFDVLNLINPDTGEKIYDPVINVINQKNRGLLSDLTILISKNGSEYFIDKNSAPVKSEDGNVKGFVVVFKDMSSEYKIKNKMKEMLNIVEQTVEGIAIADLEGNLQYVNNSWKKLHGLDLRYSYVGRNISMFHTEEQLNSDVLPFNEIVKKNGYYVGEVGHMRIDGSVFQSRMAVTLLKNSNDIPYALAAFMQDMSELLNLGEELAESELRYKTLFDSAINAIFLMKDGKFSDCNRKTFEMFGVTKEQIIGKKPNEFSPVYQPDGKLSSIKGQEKIEAVMKGNPQVFEWKHKKLNGTEFEAEISLNLVDLPSGMHILAFVKDITERKRTENEILKLRKLESIGLLAGGIAHDFNNLLSGVFGNIELAKMMLKKEHKSYKYLESAESSMENATNLTKQLLTFAKGGEPIKEIIAIGDIIRETAKFSLSGSNVKFNCEIDEDLWFVDADKGQMSQVIGNLVINAQQAMPMGGTIIIKAENDLKEEKVKIVIKDNGIGIADQFLDKIFDPYFSTKQQGNGLGLATTYSIIHKHNGIINVSSKLNEGTVFTILLPAEKEFDGKRTNEKMEPITSSSLSTKKFLVLDDEEIIRDVIGEMLEIMGIKVIFAVEGKEAVEVYKSAFLNSDPFDAVITDLTIPGGVGGLDATKAILEFNPEAKIIVSSGYATDPIMANFKKYGFVDRVIKPYRFKELQNVILKVFKD